LSENPCGALIKLMVPRNTALHGGLIDSLVARYHG